MNVAVAYFYLHHYWSRMCRAYALVLPIFFSAIAAYGCSNVLDTPQIAAAIAVDDCEFSAVGTSSPATSGIPSVISQFTGTVISANFFNSGAIDPPYFDGDESVSVCISGPDSNGDRSAEIKTDVGLDNDFDIKGYPQFLVGTKFGNIFETSYRFYQNAGLPDEDRWPVTSSNLSNQGTPFEFANLEYISVGRGVGLPAFTNDLPDISITLDIDEENIVGAERDIMLESWFYDTSTNSELIGNNVVTGLPIANTLNNIVGIGHPHYEQLDNTLLEMMVHLGALSPNDVSGAKNNPGQNQLTEVFSGKDHDLDGIDNHFDVDSHSFLNSTNPADPSPGKYSSGIDANADGIDDADLLPVQFGTQLYSIWYGQSFLAPIIIYSRETDSSLTSNFNPDIPDMDLTSEGEIQLPWNEFLEFTLDEMQPLLQTEGVAWAIGSNNLFDRINASGGAIGGVEFGVEPQINNPADQPYSVLINKFDVRVGGNSLGLVADKSAPVTSIVNPATAEAILARDSIFTGSATDTGGSGFGSIEAVVLDLATGMWFDFAGGFSTDPTRKAATLSNTTINNTDWSLSLSLPPGRYRLQVVAFDGERNNNGWTRRNFIVSESDQLDPTGAITSPAIEDAALSQNLTLAGIASDSGGSGIGSVEIVILDRLTGLWFDFDGGFSSTAIRQTTSLSNLTTNNADWSQSISLPSGRYRLQAVIFDGERNNSGWIRRNFVVEALDVLDPTGVITTPAIEDAALSQNSTLAGIASDSGGSGISSVEIVILDRVTGLWFDFNGGFSSTAIRQTTSLSNLTTENADWSQSISLPSGRYRLQAVIFDGERNNSGWIRRNFVVEASDVLDPTGVISVPVSAGATLPQTVTLAGTASDSGGSGVGSVEIVIRDLSTSLWFDFNGGFSSAATRQVATLSNLTTNNTDWSHTVSLLPGRYRLQAVVYDGERNNSGWVRQEFVVE